MVRVFSFKQAALILLAAVAAVCAVTPFAWAADSDFQYTLNNGNNAVITGYSGTDKDLLIPAELDGYAVIGIGEGAFQESAVITSVSFPATLEAIGKEAFLRCPNLKSVFFDPASQGISIGEAAFRECAALSTIDLSKIVSDLGDFAFTDCVSLTAVSFGEDFQKMGSRAFMRCASLKSVVFAKNAKVATVGGFAECRALTEVVLPDNVKELGGSAFKDCDSLESIDLPSSIEKINDYAFSISGLKNVDLASCKNLTHIGYFAFARTKISSVQLPNSLGLIYGRAFYQCRSLTSFTVPGSVREMRDYVLQECTALSSLRFERGCKAVPAYMCDGCTSLVDVQMGEGMLGIEEGAFKGCTALKTINVPEGLTGIGKDAFSGCGYLSSVFLPKSITSVGDGAFVGLAPNSTIYCLSGSAYELAKENPAVISVDRTAVFPFLPDDARVTNLSFAVVSVLGGPFTYAGSAFEPALVVTMPSGALVRDVDYRVSYSNNVDAGTASALIEPIEGSGFTGAKTVTFEVAKAAPVFSFGSSSVSTVAGQKAPANKLTCGGDGAVSYKSSNESVAKVSADGSVTAVGKGSAVVTATMAPGKNYASASASYTVNVRAPIVAKSMADAVVKLSASKYSYSGKVRKPSVKVRYGATTLVQGVDYALSYSSGCKKVGTYKVKVTGKGAYAGSVTKSFDIVPQRVAKPKLVVDKSVGRTYVKWKALKSQADGYVVVVSSKKSFSKYVSLRMKKRSTTSASFSGAKGGKTYYARVRAYKKVGGVKYYGSWSKVKRVKVR